MVEKRDDRLYNVDVYGHSQMGFLTFSPGPWFSEKKAIPEVCFWTLPEGSWSISCEDFILMALLTLYKLILFRVNVIWWKIRGCGENIP